MSAKIIERVLLYLFEVLTGTSWKPILYDFWKNAIKPALEALVKRTDSKFDDVMLNGLSRMVEIFIKPEEKEAPPEEKAPEKVIKK